MTNTTSTEMTDIFDLIDWDDWSADVDAAFQGQRETDASSEPHPKGCTCRECEEAFFDRQGFEIDDIDPFSSQEHEYMFIMGACDDDEDTIENLRGLLGEMQIEKEYTSVGGTEYPKQWLINRIERDIEQLNTRMRLSDLREQRSQSREVRVRMNHSRLRETEERRAERRANHRISKPRTDLPSKARYQKRREARPDYMQTA